MTRVQRDGSERSQQNANRMESCEFFRGAERVPSIEMFAQVRLVVCQKVCGDGWLSVSASLAGTGGRRSGERAEVSLRDARNDNCRNANNRSSMQERKEPIQRVDEMQSHEVADLLM